MSPPRQPDRLGIHALRSYLRRAAPLFNIGTSELHQKNTIYTESGCSSRADAQILPTAGPAGGPDCVVAGRIKCGRRPWWPNSIPTAAHGGAPRPHASAHKGIHFTTYRKQRWQRKQRRIQRRQWFPGHQRHQLPPRRRAALRRFPRRPERRGVTARAQVMAARDPPQPARREMPTLLRRPNSRPKRARIMARPRQRRRPKHRHGPTACVAVRP